MAKKNTTPYEHWEGVQFARYLTNKKIPFTHIPNETGHTTEAKIRASKMKMLGTSKDFPDYLIFPPGHNIAIELKRQEGNEATPGQIKWLKILARQGFHCAVAHGHREAEEFYESIVGKEIVEF